MPAAADRLEFAPPPQPGLLRGFALAVLAHLLLVLALTQGLNWKRESQDAAVEAELWSALPQQAAPKEEPAPPPPPPQAVVKAPPQPEPPVNRDADIALEREKHKRALEQERRQAELQRQRAERLKAEAQRKREEELARRKEQQQKLLADAKRKEDDKKRKLQEQETRLAKQREQLREETLRRNMAMAGTGAPSSTGTAARSSGPSASWAGKVQARVRPNIVFSDDVSGNPSADVEVRLGPGGLIIGKPRLARSSGHKGWDEAVLRALEKTESLPADTDGRYPSPVIITFRPRA
jgi:colicin import membrane protein